VNALVKDFINPLATAIYGGNKLSEVTFTAGGTKFYYGDFINTLITFLIVAAVVFFVVVQPINKLSELAIGSKDTDKPTTKKCPFCLSEIPKDATRCKFCTSKLETDRAKA
jgi:large conductance mechanosensitive channel